jgi:hypothetical protein
MNGRASRRDGQGSGFRVGSIYRPAHGDGAPHHLFANVLKA